MTHEQNLQEFTQARFGLFIHLGLYSILERGEWVLNKENIPLDEYRKLADRFDPHQFNPDQIARQAKQAGCEYLCLTTMHHEGFCLYDSQVNPFNSVRLGCKRNLVAETIEACRKHGLRVHLYHSLNHWTAQPDAVAALENKQAYKTFIDFTFARLKELVEMFNPIECLWYDGWWPFNAEGWRAEEMNAMLREIQPHLLFNGRNGLAGDFATPEGHLGAPNPWRPWEACLTHNRNWGFHAGDRHFAPAEQVLLWLTQCAAGRGNLLMNVGPDRDGQIPKPSLEMLEQLSEWVPLYRDAIYDTDPLHMDLQTRNTGDRGDWSHHGPYTASGNTLYAHLLCWPGNQLRIAGLENKAIQAKLLNTGDPLTLHQLANGTVHVSQLPDTAPHRFGGIVAIECDSPPSLYRTGGLRNPTVQHPRYDPCPSDILA